MPADPRLQMYPDWESCQEYKEEYPCDAGGSCKWVAGSCISAAVPVGAEPSWVAIAKAKPTADDTDGIMFGPIDPDEEGPYVAFRLVSPRADPSGKDSNVEWYAVADLVKYWNASEGTAAVLWYPTRADPDNEGHGMGPKAGPIYRTFPATGAYMHPAIVKAVKAAADGAVSKRTILQIRLFEEPLPRRVGNLAGTLGISETHGGYPGKRVLVSPDVDDLEPADVDDPYLWFNGSPRSLESREEEILRIIATAVNVAKQAAMAKLRERGLLWVASKLENGFDRAGSIQKVYETLPRFIVQGRVGLDVLDAVNEAVKMVVPASEDEDFEEFDEDLAAISTQVAKEFAVMETRKQMFKHAEDILRDYDAIGVLGDHSSNPVDDVANMLVELGVIKSDVRIVLATGIDIWMELSDKHADYVHWDDGHTMLQDTLEKLRTRRTARRATGGRSRSHSRSASHSSNRTSHSSSRRATGGREPGSSANRAAPRRGIA